MSGYWIAQFDLPFLLDHRSDPNDYSNIKEDDKYPDLVYFPRRKDEWPYTMDIPEWKSFEYQVMDLLDDIPELSVIGRFTK